MPAAAALTWVESAQSLLLLPGHFYTSRNMPVEHLPSEVWLIILRWAMQPNNADVYCTSYKPFQRPAHLLWGPRDLDTGIVKFKLDLMSVCRLWYSLMQYLDVLYEDIYMAWRDEVRALNASLLKPIGQNNSIRRGSLVRRLQIPYSITATKRFEPLHHQDTIKLRPNLQILSRATIGPNPETLYFDPHGPACPPLHSLKRIDWWDHGRTTRSGGINSLYEVLSNASNIEYLSLGGSSRIDLPTSIALPTLRTLCVYKMTTALLHYLCLWNLPSLSHIVVVAFDHRGQLSYLWSRFGPQLSTVEFGCSINLLLKDYISPVLRSFRELETLNYYLFLTSPPADTNAPVNAPVSTVGLHIQPYPSLGNSRQFQQHMNFLVGPALPFLRKVVFYGQWEPDMLEQVEVYLPRLHDRGCDVVYTNGLPAEHISIL